MTEEEDKKSVLYISGPMRGYAHHNFHNFFAAEDMLKKAGVHIVNPARSHWHEGELRYHHDEFAKDEITGLAANVGFEQDTARHFMSFDLESILFKCDGIVMLPGWERSAGANVEWALAKFLGISISYLYPELFQEYFKQEEENETS